MITLGGLLTECMHACHTVWMKSRMQAGWSADRLVGIPVCTHVCLSVCMRERMHACMNAFIRASLTACAHVRMHACNNHAHQSHHMAAIMRPIVSVQLHVCMAVRMHLYASQQAQPHMHMPRSMRAMITLGAPLCIRRCMDVYSFLAAGIAWPGLAWSGLVCTSFGRDDIA